MIKGKSDASWKRYIKKGSLRMQNSQYRRAWRHLISICIGQLVIYKFKYWQPTLSAPTLSAPTPSKPSDLPRALHSFRVSSLVSDTRFFIPFQHTHPRAAIIFLRQAMWSRSATSFETSFKFQPQFFLNCVAWRYDQNWQLGGKFNYNICRYHTVL